MQAIILEGGGKYINVTNYGGGNWLPPQTLDDPILANSLRRTESVGISFINGVQFYIAKRITFDFMLGFGVNRHLIGYRDYPFALNSRTDFRAASNIGFRF